MMKRTIFAAFFMVMIFPMTTAFASDEAAGCGVGKAMMEGKSGMGANIIASIVNQLLYQPTSMTFGVLGCDTTTVVQNNHDRTEFVASNLDSLSVEIAQGEGHHLTSLAAIMKIDEQDKADFYSLVQDNYTSIFDSTSTAPVQMLTALDQAMTGHPTLSKYVQ